MRQVRCDPAYTLSKTDPYEALACKLYGKFSVANFFLISFILFTLFVQWWHNGRAGIGQPPEQRQGQGEGRKGPLCILNGH